MFSPLVSKDVAEAFQAFTPPSPPKPNDITKEMAVAGAACDRFEIAAQSGVMADDPVASFRISFIDPDLCIFTLIPDELCTLIFSFLSLRDVAAMRMTSKKGRLLGIDSFVDFINSNEIGKIHGQPPEDESLKSVFESIGPGALKRLTKLKLPRSNITYVGLARISQFCPNLLSLDLKYGKGLNKPAECLATEGLLNPKPNPNPFSLCLDYASLTDSGLACILPNYPNLKELSLYESKGINAGFFHITSYCPNLLSLNLSSRLLTDDQLGNILSKCPSLQFLKLEYCNGITDTGLAHIALYCKSLKSLKLEFMPLSDDRLADILSNCPYLKLLSLRLCERITNAGLAHIALYCNTLESLNIGDLPISKDTRDNILSNCPKLKQIDRL